MKTTPYRRRPRLRARGDNRTSTDRAQAEYVVRSRRRWSRLKADCWTGNGPPARRKLKPWEQGRSHKRAAVAGDSRSAFEALQVYPFIGSRWNRARPTAPRGDVVSLALSPGRQPASAGLHPGAQLALGQLHLAGHFSVAIGHFHCGRSGWGHVVLQAGIFRMVTPAGFAGLARPLTSRQCRSRFQIQAVASGGKDGKMSTTSSTVHWLARPAGPTCRLHRVISTPCSASH